MIINRNIDIIIGYSSVLSPLVPILIGTGGFFLRPKKHYVILAVSVASLITDLMSRFFISGNNYPLIHLFGFGQALIFAVYFWQVLSAPQLKKTSLYFFVAYLVYYLLNSSFIENIYSFNTNAFSIQCILMILFSIIYYYQMYRDETEIYFEKIPDFWFVSGILFYFSVALFSFTMSRQILNGPLPWLFHNLANTTKYILFAIGLWRSKPPYIQK